MIMQLEPSNLYLGLVAAQHLGVSLLGFAGYEYNHKTKIWAVSIVYLLTRLSLRLYDGPVFHLENNTESGYNLELILE